MNLKKTANRGTVLMAYDKVNQVIIGQWRDNKVVNFVSTVDDSGLTTVKRQSGATKLDVPCPIVLQQYQKNMFGVDKGDQMRAHGAGFSNRVHFKKWYKRVYLAILDCGLLNSLIAWNLPSEERSLNRKPMARHEFYSYVAQKMCTYADPNTEVAVDKVEKPKASFFHEMRSEEHIPERAKAGTRCPVCALEVCWLEKEMNTAGVKSGVHRCKKCGVTGHNFVPRAKNKIHELPAFSNMSCFDIMHSKLGQEIWPRIEGSRFAFVRIDKHPVITKIRQEYGLHPLNGKKRKSVTYNSNDDEQTGGETTRDT